MNFLGNLIIAVCISLMIYGTAMFVLLACFISSQYKIMAVELTHPNPNNEYTHFLHPRRCTEGEE